MEQRERVLAWLRLGFSVVALVVIQLNPERSARFPILSQLSLSIFLLYSLLVVYFLCKRRTDARKMGLLTTCLDLVWITLIVFSTRGSSSPFFVFYLFPVITASSRYGVRGSLLVALIGTTLYGLMRFSPFFQNPIAIDTFLIRSAYLLAFAYIFGFLSDFEKRQNQKLAVLYKTASEAAIQEGRRSIAQELHDRLLQLLASLTLRLEVCRKQLMERPTELARELELLEEAARSSMTEIRQFLSGKAPPTLETGRLLEKLRDEMKFLRDGLGLRMVLESEPEDLSLPPHVEQELYYVLREGLINVARHSQASQAELILKESEDKIQASLQDNGIGFDPSTIKAKLSYGLGSMEERIKKLGGTFSIKSFPEKGTRIIFTVPLNSPTADNDR